MNCDKATETALPISHLFKLSKQAERFLSLSTSEQQPGNGHVFLLRALPSLAWKPFKRNRRGDWQSLSQLNLRRHRDDQSNPPRVFRLRGKTPSGCERLPRGFCFTPRKMQPRQRSLSQQCWINSPHPLTKCDAGRHIVIGQRQIIALVVKHAQRNVDQPCRRKRLPRLILVLAGGLLARFDRLAKLALLIQELGQISERFQSDQVISLPLSQGNCLSQRFDRSLPIADEALCLAKVTERGRSVE